jgi:hypothetical protein
MGYYAWRLLLIYRLLDHGSSRIRILALCFTVSDSLEMQHDESLARIGQSWSVVSTRMCKSVEINGNCVICNQLRMFVVVTLALLLETIAPLVSNTGLTRARAKVQVLRWIVAEATKLVQAIEMNVPVGVLVWGTSCQSSRYIKYRHDMCPHHSQYHLSTDCH